MRESDSHLSPDQLIDLLDGVPVDAALKQHLADCRDCGDELSALRETLSQLRQDEPPQRGDDERHGFEKGLKQKLGRTASPREGVSWYWYVAAAATLAFLSWQVVSSVVSEPDAPVLAESVLPAVDEDEEFLFLVSVVELSDDTEELEDSLSTSRPPHVTESAE